MTVKSSIQVNAAFFLMVFSLNTIVGFACSAGLDMGFNSKHHHHHDDEDVSSVKITHHHENITDHHDEALSKNKKSTEDDNCCNKSVVKFSQSDKLLTHVVNTGIETPVALACLHCFYLSYLVSLAKTTKPIQVVRRWFPNTPDIRVSIRSFQI